MGIKIHTCPYSNMQRADQKHSITLRGPWMLGYLRAHTVRPSKKWADDQIQVMWTHAATQVWNVYYGFQSAHSSSHILVKSG